MGRLRVLSGSQVCAILARHGFAEAHQRGSHIVMQKKLPETTITVPVPNHDELRVGTLQSIIRQSGVPKREFESWSHASRQALRREVVASIKQHVEAAFKELKTSLAALRRVPPSHHRARGPGGVNE